MKKLYKKQEFHKFDTELKVTGIHTYYSTVLINIMKKFILKYVVLVFELSKI